MAATRMIARAGAIARHFENGLIDVSSTGIYTEIADINAKDSPLLRLPAELRAKIWQYALDGHTIRIYGDAGKNPCMLHFHKLQFLLSDIQRFSLLRVSRQIYIETAILPYKLSTFCFVSWWDLERWLSQLSAYKLALISNVRKLRFRNANYHRHDFESLNIRFPRLEKVEMRDSWNVAGAFEVTREGWELYHGTKVDLIKMSFLEWINHWASGSWEAK